MVCVQFYANSLLINTIENQKKADFVYFFPQKKRFAYNFKAEKVSIAQL